MNKLRIAVLLALAGTGVCTSAQAATYTAGDVLIGFRSTSGGITKDYLIDIGQSLFTQAASNGGTVTIGNFGTDLATFDPNWFTDGTTRWGVAGGTLSGDASSTLYAGIAEVTNHTPYTGATVPASYKGRISGAQNSTIGLFNTVGNNFTNGTVVSGDTTVGDTGGFGFPLVGVQMQNAGGAGSASWNGQDTKTAGSAFSVFIGFDGTPGSGSLGNSLDFFQIPATSGAAPTYEGTFSVNSSGTISFTTGAVPEPSTLTALAGGIGLLGFFRRRRPVTA